MIDLFCCSVQAQVIPWLLAAHSKPTHYWPHDICVSAPTGSGKTLSFVIPIVQVIGEGEKHKIYIYYFVIKIEISIFVCLT
jgi:superfamily II DNA/RNA helicase